jgi:hypothetical protein
MEVASTEFNYKQVLPSLFDYSLWLRSLASLVALRPNRTNKKREVKREKRTIKLD